MEKRIGLAVAGAISLVVLAGTLALGASLGVFGEEDGNAVEAGVIEPEAVDQETVTVEVRDPSGRVVGGTLVDPGAIAPAAAPAPAQSFDDSSSDDSDDDSGHGRGRGRGGDDDEEEDDDDDNSGSGSGDDSDDDDDD